MHLILLRVYYAMYYMQLKHMYRIMIQENFYLVSLASFANKRQSARALISAMA